MSEAENIETPNFRSFSGRVWNTFQLIDITPYIETKKIGKTLEYLSWANAWRCVMNVFPESTFEFDELTTFDNGTCEQWVTVTIIDGDNKTSRRWWLPVLDHKNQPVQNPNSMQINNTRMRVLVKCLAMMGLGTELYAGEDVPDAAFDKDVVSGAPKEEMRHPDLRPYPKSGAMADTIAQTKFDHAVAEDYAVTMLNLRDGDDMQGVLNLWQSIDQDTKVGVWGRLPSSFRTEIKASNEASNEA